MMGGCIWRRMTCVHCFLTCRIHRRNRPPYAGALLATTQVAPGLQRHQEAAGSGRRQRGMDKVLLKSEAGATAEVYHHGAHLTSWTTPSGKELLFLSKEAVFKPPKAIRGGVPICFPQFNDMGPTSAHGFARNSTWELKSSTVDRATLMFSPSEEQLLGYPHPFELTMEVHITDTGLSQILTAKNTGTEKMDFTMALHTYLRVSAIENVAVKSLQGAEYLDSLKSRVKCREESDAIKIDSEVDRIYLKAPDTILIEDAGSGTFTVQKDNLPDAVLWNPWVDKSIATKDFGDKEFHEMVCLEPAVAGTGPEVLEPGATWVCSQKLTWSPSA